MASAHSSPINHRAVGGRDRLATTRSQSVDLQEGRTEGVRLICPGSRVLMSRSEYRAVFRCGRSRRQGGISWSYQIANDLESNGKARSRCYRKPQRVADNTFG